ncbi:hypothetical protein J5J83_22740 [Azoarcus sp. L1K30]|uniref:hypothetical protein n=1 Tax=Azoarcus sp. L1K30 TaxID=2820277 RepID=UPI001B846034|nr:hypothetical protein [Azoarcus sp. L1K30]MBR0568954.1 hypothetical protein [Azoarcus sp. L1K30]
MTSPRTFALIAALATTTTTVTVLMGANIAQALVDGEVVSSETAGDGMSSVMGTEADVASRQGFHPADCSKHEVLPAELLALADWPLDYTETCGRKDVAQEGMAPVEEAVVKPIAVLAEVAEATIRSPREILDSYGDTPAALAARKDSPAPVADAKILSITEVLKTAAPVAISPPVYATIAPSMTPAAADVASAPSGLEALIETREAAQIAAIDAAAEHPLPPSVLRRMPVLLADAPPVTDSTLDSLRGGFETPSGLRVSFGIERLVYINGELNSVTNVTLANLGDIHGKGMPDGTTLAVIQNGPNNAFVANGLNDAALATVIQNSLDNQKIQAVTTISASVNSVQMLRGVQMNHSIRDTMIQSLVR